MRLEDVTFITRSVSAEEQAAVLAILDAHIEEESAIEHEIQGKGLNAWQRSQRGLREDIKQGSRRFGWDYGR
jgi:hypothetical protein